MNGLAEHVIPEPARPGPYRHAGRTDGSAPEPEQTPAGGVGARGISVGRVAQRRRLIRRGDGAAPTILAYDDIMWRTGVRWDAEGYG